MADPKSTIRSRELGDALRLAMERAGLNGKKTAGMLGWSETRVSRLLTGSRGVNEADISALLALCMVTGEERDRLLRLAREQDIPGWLQQHGSRLPEQIKTLVAHEAKATVITDFQALVIPGLLQTGDYARAMLERSGTVPAGEIQDRVAARLGRQSLFSRDYRPNCTFYLHEFVLTLPVGGPVVMSEQLHHLLRMGVRSYITIRVVPAGIGAHAGLAGSCRLMESSEFRPVAYVEEETAGHFLEERAEILAYRNIFASLADCALDESESKELIAELAIDLYGDEDDHDRT
jgi:transcriptional regulator with XRE-family HTH domain